MVAADLPSENCGHGWLFEMTGDASGTMDAPAYVAYLEASWAKAQALLKGQLK